MELIGIQQVVAMSGVSSIDIDKLIRWGYFPIPVEAMSWRKDDIEYWIEYKKLEDAEFSVLQDGSG